MALIKCKECGKEIAKNAKQCPSCGSSKHVRFTTKHPILSVFIGLVIVGAVVNSLGGKNAVKNEPVSVAASSNQEIAQVAVKKEEVVENKNVNVPTVAPNWSYETSEDKMRGTKTNFAGTESTNFLNLGFPYDNSKMRILLRNDNGNLDILISIKGQIVCGYSEKCYLSVKADDSKIVDYEFLKAAHGSSDTVFIANSKDFMNMLKKSNKLIIEVPVFNTGRVQYNFDVSGLNWNN